MINQSLFVYGTLCFPHIMQAVTGKVPGYIEASLHDYACYSLTGVDYPAIIPTRGECVNGILYQGLNMKAVRRLDDYESNQYRRISVSVVDNQGQQYQAWSYVLAPACYHRLKKQFWSKDRFAKQYLHKYISRHGWR